MLPPQFRVDDIILSGTTSSPTPTISVIGTLNAFSTTTGTPSAYQSYTVAGSNLTANIAITAPTGYHVSLASDAGYSGSLSLTPTDGSVPTTTIYARLTGASAGTFNGDITHASTGATQVDRAVTGTVSDPAPTITLGGTLNAFSTEVGTPSVPQSYTVAGTFLTANIGIGAVTGFEYSLTSDSGYASTLSLTPSSGTVVTTTIYVRLTGASTGDYSGVIAHTSTGATQQDKAITGTVLPVGTSLIEDFNYTSGSLLADNGWTAHSGGTTQPIVVATEGLTYTGYTPASGLAAQTVFAGTAQDLHKAFPAKTEGSIYASFLFNASAANTTADYVVHLGANPIGTDFKGRFFVQKDASNNLRFGIGKAGLPAESSFSPYNYALNTTYLIMIKYVIIEGPTNDQVFMWVNPTIGTSEPAPLLTASDVSGVDAFNIGSIAIRQGTNTPIARIDGIRITNSGSQIWTAPLPQSLHVSTTSLEPLACIVNVPGEEIGSYTLYGVNLNNQLVVTAPTHFQVSTSIDSGWAQDLHLDTDFNGTIYVRMYASVVGTFDGLITHTSGSATQVNVDVSGECFPPDVLWNITQSLVPFSGQAGTATANQSYTLGTATATGDITVTTVYPFQLSTNGVNGWAAELILPYNFNATIYVRMNAISAGNFNAAITHNTANASPNSFAISGTATPPAGMAWNLFFSEYTEGLTGNNKVLEIFNGTGAAVNLSGYTVKLGSNGAAWSNTLYLTGTIENGATYVIANDQSIQAILDLANTTSSVTYFNGNDAVGLFHGTTLIDIIGVYMQNPNPTVGWDVAGVTTATANYTLIRKPTVVQGNIDFVTGAGTTAENSEWIVMPWDDYSDLGIHTFGASGPLAKPVVTITQDGANVVLNWAAITGANGGYRIESSDDPYTGFTPVTTTGSLSWSGAAGSAKKFYQVIALP